MCFKDSRYVVSIGDLVADASIEFVLETPHFCAVINEVRIETYLG